LTYEEEQIESENEVFDDLECSASGLHLVDSESSRPTDEWCYLYRLLTTVAEYAVKQSGITCCTDADHHWVEVTMH